jgi:uncharacterized MAPEG superfamily protein
MSTDLQMLVLASLWTLVLAVPPVIALMMTRGFAYAAGNRDEQVSLPAWGGRAVRTHRNMLENLPPFAALVLTAHFVDASGPATAAGATLFLWARVAHAALYLAGVPYLRTLAFAASIVGMVMILLPILSAW